MLPVTPADRAAAVAAAEAVLEYDVTPNACRCARAVLDLAATVERVEVEAANWHDPDHFHRPFALGYNLALSRVRTALNGGAT